MKNYQSLTVRSASGKLNAILTEVELVSQQGRSARITAVWDSGASSSCISKKAAQSLGLIPIGMSVHFTANGKAECFDYIADVILPSGINVGNVRISEFSGSPAIDMLIGMDIICMGDFAITNAKGATLMSYRIPPADHHTDYTQESGGDARRSDTWKHN